MIKHNDSSYLSESIVTCPVDNKRLLCEVSAAVGRVCYVSEELVPTGDTLPSTVWTG